MENMDYCNIKDILTKCGMKASGTKDGMIKRWHKQKKNPKGASVIQMKAIALHGVFSLTTCSKYLENESLVM